MDLEVVNRELRKFVESDILPCYDGFDAAHRRGHAYKVIADSLELMSNEAVRSMAGGEELSADMIYTIAAYHDLGLVADRKTHHLVSGHMLRTDERLHQWFAPWQIEVMAEAVEDHRASSDHEPRSIYGRIVAEADRNIDIDVIITRTLQYGFAHYPELDRNGHIARTLQHLREKYGPHGYLKLWIPGSRNERELHRLWLLMGEETTILTFINKVYDDLFLTHSK